MNHVHYFIHNKILQKNIHLYGHYEKLNKWEMAYHYLDLQIQNLKFQNLLMVYNGLEDIVILNHLV